MSNNVFHPFAKLPVELQFAIWKQCLPHRVVEIDVPAASLLETYCDVKYASIKNARPPVVSQVCRNSRSIALKSGMFLVKYIEAHPMLPCWGGAAQLRDQWISFETDIIHMHFNSGYYDMGWPVWGRDDIRDLFKAIATLPKGGAASVTDELIRPFTREFRSFGDRKNFKRFEEGREYSVSVKIVNVHVTREQARDTALFGISGEEFVKCFDGYDGETIAKYHALSMKGSELDVEARESFDFLTSTDFPNLLTEWQAKVEKSWVFYKWWQAFGVPRPVRLAYPADLVAWHEMLGTVWTTSLKDEDYPRHSLEWTTADNYALVRENSWVQATLREMPKFRPTVMFRLCFLECWLHSVPASPYSGGRL